MAVILEDQGFIRYAANSKALVELARKVASYAK
jgi:hypothetical protein